MNAAEGLRRICIAIRVLGVVWFLVLSVLSGFSVNAAVQQQRDHDTSVATTLRQMSDADLLAALASAAKNAGPPPGPRRWYERDEAHTGFFCFAVGIIGLAIAFSTAWILSGFVKARQA